MKKLDSGKHDGIVLAVAGIERLGLSSRICEVIDENVCSSDWARGYRSGSKKRFGQTKELVVSINDKDTFACVSAERRVALELDASCELPIGIFLRFRK